MHRAALFAAVVTLAACDVPLSLPQLPIHAPRVEAAAAGVGLFAITSSIPSRVRWGRRRSGFRMPWWGVVLVLLVAVLKAVRRGGSGYGRGAGGEW